MTSNFVTVRSQTKDTTSLGCAIAAGRAKGIDLFDYTPQNRVYSVKVHHDTYLPTSTDEDRKARNKKWKMAVERSYGWKTTIKSTTMTSKLPDSHHDSRLVLQTLTRLSTVSNHSTYFDRNYLACMSFSHF